MQDFIYDRTEADVEYVKSLNASVWSGLSAEDREAFLSSLKGAFNYTDINRIASNINEIIETYDLSLSTISQTWSENDDVIKDEIESVLHKISDVATELNRPYVEGVLDYRGVNDPSVSYMDFEDLNNLEQSLAISYQWANEDGIELPLDFNPTYNTDGSIAYYSNANLIEVPAKATMKVVMPSGYFVQVIKNPNGTPSYAYFRSNNEAHYFNDTNARNYLIKIYGGDYNFGGERFIQFTTENSQPITLNGSSTFEIVIDDYAYLTSHSVSSSTELDVTNYDVITFSNVSVTNADDIEYQLIDDNDVIYDSGFITQDMNVDLTDMVTMKLTLNNSATLDYRVGVEYTPTEVQYRLATSGDWLDYEMGSTLWTNGAEVMQVKIQGHASRYAKVKIKLDGQPIDNFNSLGVDTFVFNNYYDENTISVLTQSQIYRCGNTITITPTSVPSGSGLVVTLLDEEEQTLDTESFSNISANTPIEVETNGAVKCKLMFSNSSGSVTYKYFSQP